MALETYFPHGAYGGHRGSHCDGRDDDLHLDNDNVHFHNDVTHHVEDAIMKNEYDVFACSIGMCEAPREAITKGWCWVNNPYTFLPNSAPPLSLTQGRVD